MNSAWLSLALHWILIPVMLAAGVLLLLAIPARIHRLKRDLQDLQSEMSHLQEAGQRSVKDMQGLQKRLDRTQAGVDKCTLAIDQLSLHGETGGGYTQAIRLVERGATLEDLVAACELSPNEARLILDLHGRKLSADGKQTGHDTGS